MRIAGPGRAPHDRPRIRAAKVVSSGSAMGWRFTTDVETYAASVWHLLADDPVKHTVALSVIESVRAGHRWSDGQMLFASFDDGTVRGAVSLTPPFELLLAAVPEDTLPALIDALLREGVRFPGVNGVTDT